MHHGDENKTKPARLTRRGFVAGSSMMLLGAAHDSSQSPGQSALSSAGPADPKLIQDLAAANRILANQGVVDGYGHVSVRHNANPNRYLLSRSLAPELVTAEDIMEFDLESNPVDARGRATYVERFIHGQIYQSRPDVQAIVHSHSPSLIPFGACSVTLRPLYHMAAFIGEGVPIFEIRKVAGMSDMLVRDADRGRALARTLGNTSAALMRGHGAVVVGPSLPVVVGRSVYLEINATLQAQAMALSKNPEYLSPEEAVKATPPDNYQRAWELWKRKALTPGK
ncbi:MAG TPA: class II aldolase/adducin family protein [Candidatus Angelobacter sp.]|nr:class II aldolase/adducin family protein [Candidatus Angelobacter sp.]